jgi:hypothetical protein
MKLKLTAFTRKESCKKYHQIRSASEFGLQSGRQDVEFLQCSYSTKMHLANHPMLTPTSFAMYISEASYTDKEEKMTSEGGRERQYLCWFSKAARPGLNLIWRWPIVSSLDSRT